MSDPATISALSEKTDAEFREVVAGLTGATALAKRLRHAYFQRLQAHAYAALFWFTTITTATSGGLGFLLRVPGFYFPSAYLLGPADALAVGTGSTPFEGLCAFVFGIVYVGPLVGMAYAHLEGSAAAKRAAALMPLVYHVASVAGVLLVFPAALNPAVAPLANAAGMHGLYAVLFAMLFWVAADASPRAKAA